MNTTFLDVKLNHVVFLCHSSLTLVNYTFDVKDLHEVVAKFISFSLLFSMEIAESLLIKTMCSDEITMAKVA